jgi:hypothetical protein
MHILVVIYLFVYLGLAQSQASLENTQATAASCTELAPTLIRACPLADGSSYIEATLQIKIDGLAGSTIIRLTNPSPGSGELEGPSSGTTNSTNSTSGSGELKGPTPLSPGTTNLTNSTSGSGESEGLPTLSSGTTTASGLGELEGPTPFSSGTTNLTNSTSGSGRLEGPTPLSSIPLTQQGPRQTNISSIICTAEPWSNNTANSTYNLTAIGGPRLPASLTNLTGGGLVSKRKSSDISTLLSVAFAQAVGLLF